MPWCLAKFAAFDAFIQLTGSLPQHHIQVSAIFKILWWRTRSLQLSTCSIVYSSLFHLYPHGHAASQMPKYMTVKQPQSWIVRTESQYYIALPRNNEGVSRHKVGQIKCTTRWLTRFKRIPRSKPWAWCVRLQYIWSVAMEMKRVMVVVEVIQDNVNPRWTWLVGDEWDKLICVVFWPW